MWDAQMSAYFLAILGAIEAPWLVKVEIFIKVSDAYTLTKVHTEQKTSIKVAVTKHEDMHDR